MGELKGGSLDRAASARHHRWGSQGPSRQCTSRPEIGTSIRIALFSETPFTEASQVNWGRKGHQPKGGKQVRYASLAIRGMSRPSRFDRINLHLPGGGNLLQTCIPKGGRKRDNAAVLGGGQKTLLVGPGEF